MHPLPHHHPASCGAGIPDPRLFATRPPGRSGPALPKYRHHTYQLTSAALLRSAGDRHRRKRTRAARLLAAVLAALVLNVVFAWPAQAHATLLFTTPTINGAVPDAPPVLRLVFNEPIAVGETPVRVVDGAGRDVAVAATTLSRDDRVLTVPMRGTVPRGVLTVRWVVVGDDGDPVGGRYQFAVGPAITAAAGDTSGQQADSPALLASAALRWIVFGSLAVGLGGLLGFRIGASRRRSGLPLPTPPIGMAGVAGLVASLGLAWLVVSTGVTGGGRLTSASVAALVTGRAGQLVLLEIVGFGLAAAAAAARVRNWAVAPLLLVLAAESVRSHPAQLSPGWGTALTAVHLLAAALWVGALVQITRTAVAWRTHPNQAWGVVGAYGRLAGWLFAAVVLSGVVSALMLVPWGSWTTTSYGRVLLVKLSLVAAASVLALVARTHLQASKTDFVVSPGWAARIERAVLVGVLAVTAVLVSLPTPRPLGASAPLPLPPPPVGLVIPLGSRVGQVGMSVTASAGQLVVHLTAPVMGARVDGVDSNSYQLEGVIHTAGDQPRRAAWRGCGPGCFVSPANWTAGTNQITLQAAATGWTGGAASLTVPWPARSGAEQLRRTVNAMARVRALSLYEEVSSNTGTQQAPMPLSLTGSEFLDSEPYGSGVAPEAVVTGRRDGLTSLMVGFPGDLTQASLLIDDQHRIIRETLTAPNHLVTRTFAYPDPKKE